jgi:hypothetical protein
MKVKVLKFGKNERGFWTLVESVDADGFISTAFVTTTKEMKADKDGMIAIPTGVFSKLDWKY